MASNPVFRDFDKQLRAGQYAGFGGAAQQDPFQQPSSPPASPHGQAPSRVMTMDDVVMKSLGLFGLLLVVAGGSFFVADRAVDQQQGSTALGLWAGGGIVAFVLSLVIAFRRGVSVPLIVLYTLAEGVFLGAISAFFNASYPGVVGQAILATLCVFAGVFGGYATGLIRVTQRSRRIFMFALIGYGLFALVNFVLVLTGLQSGFGIGGSGALGIAISVFAVALASYSLAIDFDSIQNAVRSGVPEKTSWLLAYGLMVSVVWLYVEMLRLLARLRD